MSLRTSLFASTVVSIFIGAILNNICIFISSEIYSLHIGLSIRNSEQISGLIAAVFISAVIAFISKDKPILFGALTAAIANNMVFMWWWLEFSPPRPPLDWVDFSWLAGILMDSAFFGFLCYAWRRFIFSRFEKTKTHPSQNQNPLGSRAR
ncbi:hypothetical protein [Uliginosibacterium sp. TH139]|uniref:hypothetical protein n=1 Tax=Uliginosibacterium sp. TH139 TaxID=2067453 RepID=UPI00117C15B7|nr:hypothetical protein [Uliginosibacterium sp. TH139]